MTQVGTFFANVTDISKTDIDLVHAMYNTTPLLKSSMELVQANYLSTNVTAQLGTTTAKEYISLIPDVISNEDVDYLISWLKQVDIDLYLKGFHAYRYIKKDLREVMDIVDPTDADDIKLDIFDQFMRTSSGINQGNLLGTANGTKNSVKINKDIINKQHEKDNLKTGKSKGDKKMKGKGSRGTLEVVKKILHKFKPYPVLDKGSAITWINREGEQKMGWIMEGFPRVFDSSVHFIVRDNCIPHPITGNLRSPAYALLESWKTYRVALDIQKELHKAMHTPLLVQRFNPPSNTRSSMDEDAMLTLTEEQKRNVEERATSTVRAHDQYQDDRREDGGVIIGETGKGITYISDADGMATIYNKGPNDMLVQRYMDTPLVRIPVAKGPHTINRPHEMKELDAYKSLELIRQDNQLPYWQNIIDHFENEVIASTMYISDRLGTRISTGQTTATGSELTKLLLESQYKYKNIYFQTRLKHEISICYSEVFRFTKLGLMIDNCEAIDLMEEKANWFDNFMKCLTVQIGTPQVKVPPETLKELYQLRMISLETFVSNMVASAGLDESAIDYTNTGDLNPVLKRICDIVFPSKPDEVKIKFGLNEEDNNQNGPGGNSKPKNSSSNNKATPAKSSSSSNNNEKDKKRKRENKTEEERKKKKVKE